MTWQDFIEAGPPAIVAIACWEGVNWLIRFAERWVRGLRKGEK